MVISMFLFGVSEVQKKLLFKKALLRGKAEKRKKRFSKRKSAFLKSALKREAKKRFFARAKLFSLFRAKALLEDVPDNPSSVLHHNIICFAEAQNYNK